MAWEVDTKWGVLRCDSKSDLPSLDEYFVTGDEYRKVGTPSVNQYLNDKYMVELMHIIQSFYEELEDADVSVKNLEVVSESLFESMSESLSSQLFTLEILKNQVNRSDRASMEKRRSVNEIQDKIDRLEDELENLDKVRKEVLDQ